MKREVKKVSDLRFPEFEGEWDSKMLKEITKINQGLQIAISERYTEPVKDGYFYITNEFLRPNNKTQYFIKNPPKSVVCNENDILIVLLQSESENSIS